MTHMHLLIFDFLQHKPAVVPALRALRISDHLPFRFVYALGAERIRARQATQLAEEVVGIHEMRPCSCQSSRDFWRSGRHKDTLDSAQFDQRVDSMSAKRL